MDMASSLMASQINGLANAHGGLTGGCQGKPLIVAIRLLREPFAWR